MRAFPQEFVWGAAAAAYQIEGATARDGRGPSIWDAFCERPGAVWNGQDGRDACQHYDRYAEDVGLMAELGLRAYRLSLSWSRILPEGTGSVNEAGLDFYDRLVDALLAAKIDPWVTLYHWDLPLALYHRGGWLNRDVASWMADYATVVARRLGDRVKHFLTINEPQVFVEAGMAHGRHAPGDRLAFPDVLRAGHHTLLAHGRAIQALRSEGNFRLGYAPVGVACMPRTKAYRDLEAAKEAFFDVAPGSVWNSAWWMDPVFLGTYPEVGLRAYGSAVPRFGAADLEIISQPLDLCGVNIYHGRYISAEADGRPREVPLAPGDPITAFEWPVTPEALHFVPRWLHERYGKPVVITENGLSCRDWVSVDGRVHDPSRIDFITRYLRELYAAIEAGADIMGYFHWSIFDNFEWEHGYKHRFGLVFVDFATGRRVVKDSAAFYREIIATRGANILG